MATITEQAIHRLLTRTHPPAADKPRAVDRSESQEAPEAIVTYDGRDVMVIKGPNARNDFHLVDS
jgi:hypothetical protein